MKRLRVINTETGEDWSEMYTLRHRNQDAAFRQQQEKTADRRDFSNANMLSYGVSRSRALDLASAYSAK